MALTSYTGTSGNFINLNIPQNYASAYFNVNTSIPAGAYQLTIPSGISSVVIGSKTFTSSGIINVPTTATSAQGEVSYIPLNWTTRSWSGQTRSSAVAYGNGVFIAVGYGGRLGYSTDGITWTSRNSMQGGTTQINTVVFGNGIFLAGGNRADDNVTNRLSTSTDGLTWTSRSNTNNGSADINAIAAGGGIYVYVGRNSAGNGILNYSSDSITWANVTNFGSGIGTNLWSIGYGDGQFIYGGTAGQMASSLNGVVWSTRTSGFGTSSINGIAYGNGVWVAGGDAGVITSSTDGITWTARTSGFAGTQIRAVKFLNGYFYATGGSGTMSISTNGTTWTPRGTGIAASLGTLVDMTYGEGTYVQAFSGDQFVNASTYTVPSDLTVQLEYKGVSATAV